MHFPAPLRRSAFDLAIEQLRDVRLDTGGRAMMAGVDLTSVRASSPTSKQVPVDQESLDRLTDRFDSAKSHYS